MALILEVMTDNKNRSVAEIRHALAKYGGNLGANGCVAWMFDKKGVITIDFHDSTEDALMDIALDAGAEDIISDSGAIEIITPPEALDAVRQAIEAKGITMASAEITMRPQSTVSLTNEKEANSMLRMYELLEDIEDVQKVYANFDIEESLLETIA